jgi:hypothetical protein
MITAEYINALRKQVDKAYDRFESNPTRKNEFMLELLVTSLEARLRAFDRQLADRMHEPTDDTLC